MRGGRWERSADTWRRAWKRPRDGKTTRCGKYWKKLKNESGPGRLAERMSPQTIPRTVEATLASERAAMEVLLAGAGLDEADLDRETEGWIRALSRASRSRLELTEVQAEIESSSRDIDEVREDLYRYLSRRGSAGGEGRADTATLAAGLERLARAAPSG